MKKLYLAALAILLLFVSCNENYSQEVVQTVYKEDTKDFVILNLTDIQLGTTAYLTDFDRISEMIDRLIKETEPNLITITGDISYGCSTAFYGICSFINSYCIPWAPVFGNHDHEDSGMTEETQREVLSHYKYCLYPGKGASTGYVVNIVNKDNNKTVKSLFMIDSGTNGIEETQLDWYKEAVAKTNGSSAVFCHIPVYGFREAAKAAYKSSIYSLSLKDSYKASSWNTGYENSFGVLHESLGPTADDGFASCMRELGSSDLIVCGHNHENCACIKHNGITFCYGLKTGPGCYYDPELCGGTAITIKNDGSFTVKHVFDSI